MSDSGMMHVGGDYQGNLKAIIKVMNQWEWSVCGDLKFEVIGTTIDVQRDLGWVFRWATAHPQIYDKDGEGEPVALETISREISPLLESGRLGLTTKNWEYGDD